MDEKLTPADVLRKGIDAVADAENKGIHLEETEATSLSFDMEDDAVEFTSFSIDDTRDTEGTKAGTRLPTVSMPDVKVTESPVTQETILVDLPEDIKVSPARDAIPNLDQDPEEVEMVDIYSHSDRPKHSKTWLRNQELREANAAAGDASEEPHEKTQEELLAEIFADTPEERRRKEAAQEEGRRLAEDIFSEEKTEGERVVEEAASQPTQVIPNEEMEQIEALERFLQDSKKERRERLNMAPAGTSDVRIGGQAPDESGYFGVGRKSGFKQEAAAAAAGGRVIESRSLAVDPTTLTRKELREYNRINRRGEKVPRKKGKLRLWQKILIILLALILLVVGAAGVFFGRYYGLLGNLDNILGENNPVQRIQVTDQSEANEKSLNILLVGLDSRKDNYTGLSDSMILCTINKSSKKFIMTSLLRDSYVSIPGHGKDKLNKAYAEGGSNLLINTIYENYGIVVDRVAVFNFLFVIDVIDYLGGVTVELTKDEIPYLNMYIHDQNEELFNSATPNKGQIHSGPGTYNLTGNQALAYARIRYVGTDVARSERQRLVLQECIEKCKNLNAAQLNEMAKTFLPRIKTDMTMSDTSSLIITLLRSGSYQTNSLSLPIEGTWKDAKVGDQEVVKITDFEKNTKAWEEAVS